MPRWVIAAAALAFLALPATAQDGLDPAEVGANAARDFWCATAFGIASSNAAQAGDSVASISLSDAMTTLFQRLLLQMQEKGFSREQYNVLAARYLAEVLDPFRPTDGAFTREQCDAAVDEADAALAAPPEVVPENGAVTP